MLMFCHVCCLQVPCPFAGNIVVRVNNYRATAGGWLRLALRNVAGNADISSVEVARVSTYTHMQPDITHLWPTQQGFCSHICCPPSHCLLNLGKSCWLA